MSLYQDIINDLYEALPQDAQRKLDEYIPRAVRIYVISCFVYAAVVGIGLALMLWIGSNYEIGS